MQMVEVNTLKEWVKNWFIMNRHYHPYAKSNNIPIPELYDILERMPTIDAVPVVRCADCIYWEEIECSEYGVCNRAMDIKPHGTVYCAFGERKDGDGDG